MKMTTINNKMFDSFTLVKALDDVDQDKAVELVSTPNLDPKELSSVIECSLLGKVVNKESKEPLKLSNKVMAAAILNRLNQIEIDLQTEI